MIQDKEGRMPMRYHPPMTLEHGHTPDEIAARLAAPASTGHLRDFVYGGIDGTVTTFAIVAGVAGAGLSHKVIIALGIANVLADGFSMAAGNYSGTTADKENVARLRALEERHIRQCPEGEREEVRQIMAAKGLSGEVLEGAVESITRDERTWINLMMQDEHGMAPVDPSPLRAALATFGAFLLCGMVPLGPFLFGLDAPFVWASAMTGAVFFAIGAMQSRWSLRPWWRSGIETLAIGGTAAAIAYGVGHLVNGWT